MDDTDLIDAALRGDGAAFGALVRPHAGVALRVAAGIVGSASDGEDVLQEALLRAHGALGSFELGRPFRPWLLRIVANQARNHRRSAGRRLRVVERASALRTVPASDPADVVALNEDQALLYAALGRLALADREVLACRYLAQLSEAETAAALQLRVGTVKSRTHRALLRLREEVDRG